ncbi:hypothetical protein [Nocardia pseudovaccinii]|uniref:hypothetical protein n=1 Tax=Nocardia pseudovaccinii TaxID=189540 RepID=UPI0012F4EB89|nr:hypothetical protein [Nocardia pseudovaccinii]
MTAGAAALWIRAPRFVFALLGVLTLVWTPIRNIGESGLFVADFHHRIRCARRHSAADRGDPPPRDRRWQVIRLSNIRVGDEQGWVDDVLQRIMPMVMIVDWESAPVALGISERLIAGRLVVAVVALGAAVGADEPDKRRSDVVVE